MNAAMNNAAHELEAYLRRATRGVYGGARAVIRAELRANLFVRARELELLGLSAPEALRRAIAEMGAPETISGGMIGLYSLPRLARGAALTLCALWCCLAPLEPLTVRVQASAVSDVNGKLMGVHVPLMGFAGALRAAGISLEHAGDSAALRDLRRASTNFSSARAWDARDRAGLSFSPPRPWTLNLSLALEVMCDLNASLSLEPSGGVISIRASWPQRQMRFVFDLDRLERPFSLVDLTRNLKLRCLR